MRRACPICTTPGHTCGDDHMRGAPVDVVFRKDTSMAEPVEMKEYEYYVGHVKTTAMLTEKMAKRLGAKPVGEAQAPEEGNVDNNEAQRASTDTREAEDAGVKATYPDGTTGEDAQTKQRSARNKRSVG